MKHLFYPLTSAFFAFCTSALLVILFFQMKEPNEMSSQAVPGQGVPVQEQVQAGTPSPAPNRDDSMAEPVPFHRMKGTAWQMEQWWNETDGLGFAFSANIRFIKPLSRSVPVLKVWEGFTLAVSPENPLQLMIGNRVYAAEPLPDVLFFPAGQWVKIAVSWDPVKKEVSFSRNGFEYPVTSVSVVSDGDSVTKESEEIRGSREEFDVFCDRLFPNAVTKEKMRQISLPPI